MSELLPKSGRPRLDPDLVRAAAMRALLADEAVTTEAVRRCPVILFASRGYYRNTMGRRGVNDFGVYDDACWIVTPSGGVHAYNWNCDPSKVGWNAGVDKYYAQLAPGVWPFRQGPHRGRPGHFRQFTDEEADLADLGLMFRDERRYGEFLVRRVHKDETFAEEWGYQAINIHPGSNGGTGSWGCSTCPPSQWPAFQSRLYAAMDASGQNWALDKGVLLYVLSEESLS